MNTNKKDWITLLNKLDTHKAPDHLNLDDLNKSHDRDWLALLNKLPEEIAPELEPAAQKEAKIITFFNSTKSWLSIAASILITLSVWIFWTQKDHDTTTVLTKQTAEQLDLNVANEEAAWSLEAFCEAYEIQCDYHELGQFREEWEEVSTAILSVMQSLQNNQNDEFLLRQLSTLEARHAELVNELLKIVWS